MPIERLFDSSRSPLEPEALYEQIEFPEPPQDRPYIYINMAATVDGRVVLGSSTGSAAGVGGPTDQRLFRRLQRLADGALIGASTLRASQVIYPPGISRFAATRSGDVPLDNRFFADAPGRAYVLAPASLAQEQRERIANFAAVLTAGATDIDWAEALRTMRQQLGIRKLLCEGGSQINGQLMAGGFADELFLTIAPKVKGDAALPGIVSGLKLPSGQAVPLKLISVYRDEDEIYLRYHVASEPRLYRRESPG